MTPLRPGDPRELVRLDVVVTDIDGPTMLSDPVPRAIAEEAVYLFGPPVEMRVYGRRVYRALIVPEVP